MTSKEKTAFRKTSKWKNWCKYLKAKRGLKCECCGTETKRLSVHHMDEAHYTDLKEKKFVLVCSCCHKSITRLERIKTENWYKYNPQWVAFYSRFLIREENTMKQNDVKNRYEGIQTAFIMAGDYACLFLSLLSIAEEYTGLPVDFIVAYRKCIDLDLIEKDFFCNDQEKILYTFTGKKWKKSVLKELPSPIPENMFTVEKWHNDRTGFTHFRRRGFDTLESSVTVKEGKVVEYYCYEAEGDK